MNLELDQFRDVDLVIDYANYTFIEKQFVSQGDYKGRTLTVLVTNKGVVGEVPGLMLNLNWHNEASGLTDLSAFSVLDKANSIYRIEYPQHMMTPGRVIASIQVIQNGKVTNLKQFELTVQRLAGQAVGIIEKAEYSALVAVLADSNKFRTDIDSLSDRKVDKNGNEQVGLFNLKQEVKEAMTGGSVAVVGEGAVNVSNIVPRAVTPSKTSFFTKRPDTLFDGEWANGFYLSGSANTMKLTRTAGFKTMIVPCSPNTTYTIIKEPIAAEDGNWYFKIATSSMTVDSLKNITESTDINSYYQFSATNIDTTLKTFLTGPNDKSIVIVCAKSANPYTELLVGIQTDFKYNDYNKMFDLTVDIPEKRMFFTKNGDILFIYTHQKNGWLRHTYERFIDNSINVDVWRATDVYVCSVNFDPLYSITTGDNEGVIRLDGESDYIGGWHGDEIGQDVFIYVDDNLITSSSNLSGYCDKVQIIVKSDIYHADTQNLAFIKYKDVTYKGDEILIKCRWIAQSGFTVQHIRAGIYSIYKEHNGIPLVSTMRNNDTYLIDEPVHGIGGAATIQNIIMNGNIHLNVELEDSNSQQRWGSITDFGTRYKIYLDSFVNQIVAKNEPLNTSVRIYLKLTD